MKTSKHKNNITQRLLHIITYHPALKVISLILAIILWFYIKGELELSAIF